MVETFFWDGLALLRRGDTIYINEPHPSGGAVIASIPVGQPGKMMFYLNDMLGTTLASVEGHAICYARLSAFGQQLEKPAALTPADVSPPVVVPDLSQQHRTQTNQKTTRP